MSLCGILCTANFRKNVISSNPNTLQRDWTPPTSWSTCSATAWIPQSTTQLCDGVPTDCLTIDWPHCKQSQWPKAIRCNEDKCNPLDLLLQIHYSVRVTAQNSVADHHCISFAVYQTAYDLVRPFRRHLPRTKWMNEWMNEFIRLKNKSNQAGTPRHDNCVHLPVS